jgi:hypothetical protein
MRDVRGAVRGLALGAAASLAACGAGDGYRAEVTGAEAAEMAGPATFCADPARGFVLVFGRQGPGEAGFSLALPGGRVPAAGDSIAVAGEGDAPRPDAFSAGPLLLGTGRDRALSLVVRSGSVVFAEAGEERVRGEVRLALEVERRDPAISAGPAGPAPAALAATFAAEPGDACGPAPRGAGTAPASPGAEPSPPPPGTP